MSGTRKLDYLYKNLLYEYSNQVLSTKEQEFLHLFGRAWYYNDRRAAQELATKRLNFNSFYNVLVSKRNAESRDMLLKWKHSESNTEDICGRCLKETEECKCVAPQRGSHYQVSDWRASMDFQSPEKAMVEYLDKHAQAVDMLPYGNGIQGLKKGTSIRLAIPKHVLQGLLGSIIKTRESDGKYQVLVYKGRDTFTMFCKPNEILIKNNEV